MDKKELAQEIWEINSQIYYLKERREELDFEIEVLDDTLGELLHEFYNDTVEMLVKKNVTDDFIHFCVHGKYP